MLVNKLCTGRHGLCSRTGKHHIVLTGTDRNTGKLWTRIAEPYPPKLCSKLAAILIETSDLQRSAKASNLLTKVS